MISLAVDGNVAASAQNQTLGALLFLYRDVLRQHVPWLDDLVYAEHPHPTCPSSSPAMRCARSST